jgi:hypothetical protein
VDEAWRIIDAALAAHIDNSVEADPGTWR